MIMDDLVAFFEKIPNYAQLFVFFIFHWCRLFMNWCYHNCIKPIENIIYKYQKKEPSEPEWIQLYCFTENTFINHYGMEGLCYNSYDKYVYPYITNFVDFLENEHMLFAEHNQIELPYEHEFEQFAKPLETLFIAKSHSSYLIRSYNHHNHEPKKQLRLDKMPESSSISFLFVEYYHPKMKDMVELNIPIGYYLEGNELFSPAFVHRMLELMNIYYYFDLEYEIRFLDHTMTPQILRSDEYLEIKQEDYERKSILKRTPKEGGTVKQENMIRDEELDLEIIENDDTEKETDKETEKETEKDTDTETTSISTMYDSGSDDSDIENIYPGYWLGWIPFW